MILIHKLEQNLNKKSNECSENDWQTRIWVL
jgi:hypothetical protein